VELQVQVSGMETGRYGVGLEFIAAKTGVGRKKVRGRCCDEQGATVSLNTGTQNAEQGSHARQVGSGSSHCSPRVDRMAGAFDGMTEYKV